jgi:hypothetical protein
MGFSWHEPHDLYAEYALCALALCIVLYSICGKNKWVKTHGLILVFYYGIGGLAYDEFENWSFLDTCYFLTVTITTVGYGDFCPESDEGKLFTVAYAVVGIVFVFAALSPLLDAITWVKNLILSPITPYEPTDPRSPCMDDVRGRGHRTAPPPAPA